MGIFSGSSERNVENLLLGKFDSLIEKIDEVLLVTKSTGNSEFLANAEESLDLQNELSELKKQIDSKREELNRYDLELQGKEERLKELEVNLEEKKKALEALTDISTKGDALLMERMEQMSDKLMKLSSLIEESAYKDKIIKELHETVQGYNRDIFAELAKPYLKNIMKIHERLTKTYNHFSKMEACEMENMLEVLMIQLNDNGLMVQDMLEDEYDLVYFEPEENSSYMPKEHTALKILYTEDETKAGNISECISGGFRELNTNKVFKPAVVSVYRLVNNVK